MSVYSNLLPRLFPQHGPGPKHLRPIALTEEQQRLVLPAPFLKGLMHSEGTRYVEDRKVNGKTYSYVQYAFTNESADILTLAFRAAERLGLHPTTSRGRTLFFRRRRDVVVLERIVGPKQ